MILDRITIFLGSQGGHVSASLYLIMWGTAMLLVHIPEGKEVIMFALGVLSRSMETKKLEISSPAT